MYSHLKIDKLFTSILTDVRLPLLCRNSISLYFDLSMWNSKGNKENSTRNVFIGSS